MTSSAVLYRRLLARARFRHLQALVHVSELGSMKRAAERIGLTQPAVTQAIADLEQLLECSLFYRHRRGMRLTATGLELLPFVQRAMAAMEEGIDRVVLRRLSAQSVVRVGAIEGAIRGLLTRALPEFSRRRPDLTVEVEEVTVAQAADMMTRGEVDVLLCRQATVAPETWDFTELMPDRLVVVAGPQHPLAGRKALTMTALLSQTWLILPPATEARRRFDELMSQYKEAPSFRRLRTRSFDVMLGFLQSEHLVLMVPLSIVRPWVENGDLVALDIEEALPLRPIGILSSSHDSEDASAALTSFLVEYVKSFP